MKNIILILVIIAAAWYVIGRGEKIKNSSQPVSTIVAFGDSLTAGYGAISEERSYPAVLAQLSGKKVINEGYVGETAVDAPRHLTKVLEHQPQMVLIEFGANDFMRASSREAAVEAVAAMVDAVQAYGAIAVIVDTAGPGMSAYTRAYKKLAKKKKAIFVPGIMAQIRKSSQMSDNVHPNAAGYKIIAEHVYKVIEPYLK